MKSLAPALLALLVSNSALAADHNMLSAGEKSEGYVLLFNGKDLSGWDGDPDIWSAEDGLLIGTTDNKDITANTFLISKQKYGDFVLKGEMKLRNHNSGIQIRSEDKGGYVVHGYQADAASGNWWGSLYSEKTGRGVIANGWKDKGETVAKKGDWNQYEITCKGKHITLKLNGLTTVDIEDDMSSSGVIALQVHQGPKMRVAFRNLKLKKL